jgi:hypothetical protein
MSNVFESMGFVEVNGDDPDWVLQFEKIKDNESGKVVYRFVWNHNGKRDFKMCPIFPKEMMFKAIAKAYLDGLL